MAIKKGFTLIEVIISIAIIGITIVSLLSTFNTGLINIVRAGVRTEAVDMAEYKFMKNSQIVGESINLKIDLPTPTGNIEHTITGYIRRGNVLLNEGMATEINVEIQAFVPD